MKRQPNLTPRVSKFRRTVNEYLEVEEGYLALQQPPRHLHNEKIIFAFTPEGENKHRRLIKLLSKASKTKAIKRSINTNKYQIVWESSDGQLGLKPLD